MVDWLFIMFLVIAFLLTLLVLILDLEFFWKTTFVMIAIVLWFLLAASIMEIEIPYTAFNSTSGQIETGSHIFSSKISPYIVYFFQMIAIILMIYFVAYIFGPELMDRMYPNRHRFKRY